MNKKDIKFDHSNNVFHDAVGLSKDEMVELLAQSKKIFKNIDKKKKSAAVEEILNIICNMNHKEISVIIFLLVDRINRRVSGTLINEIVKMIETDMPPPSPKLPNSDDKLNLSYM